MAKRRALSVKVQLKEGRLLLVEGRDEVNLLGRLVEHCLGDHAPIQILDVGSKDNFTANLRGLVVAAQSGPAIRSIGVVRDADTDPEASFESVCNSLRAVGYEPPAAHSGFSDGDPSVGVFIAPDGLQCGAIEALCRRSVEGEAAVECVEDYLSCLKARRALQSRNEDKTFAHAYLASMREPVARVGEGAQQGVWNLSSPAFEELSRFLRNLHSRGSN